MRFNHHKQVKGPVDGHKGWYDIAYDQLLSDVKGYIRAGFDKQRAIEKAFSESCASKGIKHKIEDLILGN